MENLGLQPDDKTYEHLLRYYFVTENFCKLNEIESIIEGKENLINYHSLNILLDTQYLQHNKEKVCKYLTTFLDMGRSPK